MQYNVIEIDGVWYLRVGMQKVAVIVDPPAARALADTLNKAEQNSKDVAEIKRWITQVSRG